MRNISVIGKYVWLLLFLVAGFLICKCTSRCCSGGSNDTLRVDSIVKHDTIYIEKHDTLPQEKGEKVIKYVKIPYYINDTVYAKDSIQMQIVQKTFSDDSTYTAYVCGIKYENLPKLDSITIRQRDIINTVVKTITVQKKRSRWSVGLQGGYGYGLGYKGFEPYVGFGVEYTLPQ
jgi:hypothetical protein